MEAKIILGRCCTVGGAAREINWHHNIRFMVTKASNRAAVHAAKIPDAKTINEEEVEMEIQKGKEKRRGKRQEVEKTVDSQINRSDVSNKASIK